MMNAILQFSCALIFIFCFYLLAVGLKDSRVKIDHPSASGRFLRLALCGVLVSMAGYLVVPDMKEVNLSILITSVLLGVSFMAVSYRRNYLPMEIEFVDYTEFVNFPKDKYAEVAPGVFCRNYDFDGKVITGAEVELVKIASNYDPNRWACVFFDIGRDLPEIDADGKPDFPKHKHKKREKTHLIKGRAEIIVGAPDLTPDLPFTVPPRTTHYFKRKGHCMGASFVEK